MSNFWHGKRVAVTGGAGFLGSHLIDQLIEQGAIVTSIDNLSRGRHFVHPELDTDRLNYIDGDASSVDECASYFGKYNADAEIVFNLAASVGGVLWNQTHNMQMYQENMPLQTAPIVAAMRLKIPRFVQVSSVCVYAPEYAVGAVEANGQLGEPVAANNGYAWAKRMGERVALWSDLPSVSIVRPSNMYGPRDYFDDRAHVIPALIKQCLHADVIKLHGTGDEVREFLYVEDAARGLLAVAEHGENREAYNLGTNGLTKIAIRDLVSVIQNITQTQHKPVEIMGGDAGDSERWSNCNKLFGLNFEFKSDTSLWLGLIETVEWYQREVVTA